MTRKTETLNDFKQRVHTISTTPGVRFVTLVHRPEAEALAHAGHPEEIGDHRLAVRAALLLYEFPPAHEDTKLSIDVRRADGVDERVCVFYLDNECSLVIAIVAGEPISKSLMRVGKRFREAWESSRPDITKRSNPPS